MPKEFDEETLRKFILDTMEHAHPAQPPTPPASAPDTTATGPKSGESDGAHLFKTYARSCLGGCGKPNPNYRKPDVFCKDCGAPMGSLPDNWETPKSGERKDVPGTEGGCLFCGGQDAVVKK